MHTYPIVTSPADVPPHRRLSKRLLENGYNYQIFDLDRPHIKFTAPNGWVWVTRKHFMSYPFVSSTAYRIAKNKQTSYALAEYLGVSIPKTIMLPEMSADLKDMIARHAPLVVKPLASFSSHGLTMDLVTEEAVDQAIQTANKFNETVLVQQQFTGHEARFTIVRGKVISCLLRQPPCVTGDGVSSIAELIKKENEERKPLAKNAYVPYPLLDESLLPAETLNDATVPKHGEVVMLSKTSLPNEGASISEISSETHKSYKDIALRLGAALNSEFAVVDMLIEDYTVPATADNYVFLEFTLSPSLRLYYDVRSGQDYDMIGTVVNLLDEMSTRK